jgi:hypothetical protein
MTDFKAAIMLVVHFTNLGLVRHAKTLSSRGPQAEGSAFGLDSADRSGEALAAPCESIASRAGVHHAKNAVIPRLAG